MYLTHMAKKYDARSEEVPATFTASARRLGIISASGTVLLSIAYAIPLTAGLLSLPSPDTPIGDPWFPMMEVLIILTMPVMVALMVAVHAWAAPQTKVYSLLAVVFMALLTVVTCSVHFVILTVSHRAEFVGQSWLPLVLSFKWLSITYTLDVLAWDVFFALAALSVAPVFSGGSLAKSIRVLMIASGALSLGGLSGVFLNNSSFRSIGIVGYAVVFPVAALLLAVLFSRTKGLSGPNDRAGDTWVAVDSDELSGPADGQPLLDPVGYSVLSATASGTRKERP
jgi:hypothetical protein